MSEFSSYLARLRKEAGFDTAHEFYAKNDGRKVLKISYVNYWQIEKGDHLPRPQALEKIVACLRLPPETGQFGELARLYLKALVGRQDTFDWLMAAAQSKPLGAEAGFARRAARQLVYEQARHFSVSQTEAILHDFASFWVHMMLCADNRSWMPAELAQKIRVRLQAVQKAVRVLASRKIVMILPNGGIRSPFAGKHVVLAPLDHVRPDLAGKVAQYHAQLQRRGKTSHQQFLTLRAEESELKNFYMYLNATVSGAAVYDKPQRTADSAFYLIESRVSRLFPF